MNIKSTGNISSITFIVMFGFLFYTGLHEGLLGFTYCFADTLDSSKISNKRPVDLFTPEELQLYDGGLDSKGLYLAFLGKVYDVREGAQHYKPSGGYSFFAGRDATRAYVTGDFSDEGLIDDVKGLSNEEMMGINNWMEFYDSEYVYVGKVVGRYYDKDGHPTQALQDALAAIEKAKANKRDEAEEKQIFPPCNSEWSAEKGGRVWCSNKSGGIDRNWIGVPRKLYRPGETEPRCACVRTSGPPSGSSDTTEHENRGDLDSPLLKEYPNCSPESVTCSLSP
ncbi:neuferricin-like isoform X1 [Limulus polyphemus]|uniref:Neuferricin-like isoform X1 n=1 Tax=Limulus polyphemus TaxID=6850 RepID=A0ABM1BK29_LIMPO|nr:neuferricin-like isoform X1 [Limulus polyphemus]